jgi:ABC-type sugar transport system ATPase subunit
MIFPSGTKITLRELSKRYGNTRALHNLDLDLFPGEVLGIAGPNGAGKSTLIRVLAGEEDPDTGDIRCGDERWSRDFLVRHVAVVHQEPQLFSNLTVAENLLVGREGTQFKRPGRGQADRDLMVTMGIESVADQPLSKVRLATRQRVEIGRALARNAKVLLFDEPNSALSADESTALFHEIHRVAEGGNVVILVTHRLEDLVQHTTRVVVVREGRVAAELTGAALTEEAIARLLVRGLRPDNRTRRAADLTSKAQGSGPVAKLASWSQTSDVFSNIDVSIEPGEVVALLGVEGSGAREFLRSVAGFETARGEIEVAGRRSMDEIRQVVAYVAPSREDSLFRNLSVGENMLARVGRPDIARRFGWLKTQEMRKRADAEMPRFSVKAESAGHNITTLSGGNQQKVAIAQALLKEPILIALEEPTRGVDVGSKREIYELLRNFAGSGAAVLIFCTEILEVFEAADRALVFVRGRLSGSITIADHDRVEELAAVLAKVSGEAA